MDSVLQHLADRFEIKGALGSGAYATVYRAFDKRLEREVAVKILHMESVMDPDAQLRFEREAKTLCSLNHPNIVRILSFGLVSNHVPYMVSELLTGQSLRQVLLSNAPMPLEEVRRIAVQACQGLEFVHENLIVHRDLKPENLFICDNGNVKLIDLGLCGFAPGSSSGQMSLTSTGMVVGTLSYMSPEQVRGEKLDGRSDLYSLGCIIYECLAGQPPFSGDDVVALMMQHNSVEPDWQFLTTGAPAQSEDLIHVVKTALCKDRNRRFQSARELLNAISSANYRSRLRLSGVPQKVSILVATALAVLMIAVMIFGSPALQPEHERTERIELPQISKELQASRWNTFVRKALIENRVSEAVLACRQLPLEETRQLAYADTFIFTAGECLERNRFHEAHELLSKLKQRPSHSQAREAMRLAIVGIEPSNRELALQLADSDIRLFAGLKLPTSEILPFEFLYAEMGLRGGKCDEAVLQRLSSIADRLYTRGGSDAEWNRLNELYFQAVKMTNSTVRAEDYLRSVPDVQRSSKSTRSSFYLIQAQCALAKHKIPLATALFHQALLTESDVARQAAINEYLRAAKALQFSQQFVAIRSALGENDRCRSLINDLKETVGSEDFARDPVFGEFLITYLRLAPLKNPPVELEVRKLADEALRSKGMVAWRPAIYRSLAVRQSDQRLYEECMKTCEAALAVSKATDPSKIGICTLMGAAALHLKKYDRSEAAFRRGIAALPFATPRQKTVHGASLHIGLVDTFIATGRREEAAKILSVELEADPSASYRQELIRRVDSLKADHKLAK